MENKRVKILIFSWRGPGHPNIGGAEIVTHEYAKAWVKAGHRVVLFTALYENAKSEESLDGVKIIRKGDQILRVQLAAIAWYLFENKEKFDLVVDQFHGIPFFTPLYVKSAKLAFIHEVAREVWFLNHLSWPYNIFFGAIGRITEPFIFKFFYRETNFLTVSESTEQDLVKWGIPKKNISIIKNGIYPAKIKLPKAKKQSEIITFLGALSRDKGIETAIEVFGLLNSMKPSVKFWVIGKGEVGYLKQIKDLAREKGVLKKIKFWGYVSESKKIRLVQKSILLINPSIKEGWGLTVIEGASVGTPSIAFDVAGLRDSIKDQQTGIIVKEKNIQTMAVNIVTLLDDKQKISKLSKQALKWSKQFSWAKSSKESLKLINELV